MGGTIYPAGEYQALGKPVYFARSAGEFAFTFRVDTSGSSNIYQKMTVSGNDTEYVKAKIHLAEEFRGSFTENGWMILTSSNQAKFGTDALPRGYNAIQSEGGTTYMYCDFCIVSGSLIQLPAVDENGIGAAR